MSNLKTQVAEAQIARPAQVNVQLDSLVNSQDRMESLLAQLEEKLRPVSIQRPMDPAPPTEDISVVEVAQRIKERSEQCDRQCEFVVHMLNTLEI